MDGPRAVMVSLEATKTASDWLRDAFPRLCIRDIYYPDILPTRNLFALLIAAAVQHTDYCHR